MTIGEYLERPSTRTFGGTKNSKSIYLTLASSCLSTTSIVSKASKDVISSASKAGEILSKGSAMIYYSTDPQFTTLLFSLSSRGERCSSIFPSDPFAAFGCTAPSGSDIVTLTQSTFFQLLEIGQHYACFLSQVRAGSLVLFVGVGSLVCYRLWSHWRDGETHGAGDGPEPSPNGSPSKATRRGRTGLLASFLEEELFNEEEEGGDDDPAFIHGRYFGPSSPGFQARLNARRAQSRAERRQLLGSPSKGGTSSGVTTTSTSATSTPNASDKRYHADKSDSTSKDKSALSSSCEDDLELIRARARHKRRKRKLHRNSLRHSSSHNKENTPSNLLRSTSMKRDSESRNISTKDGSHKATKYANADSDEFSSDVEMDNSESIYSGASFHDLMEKMRHRQSHRSISRDPSVCSNLSESLLYSPTSLRRYQFKREDSICSNLSDFALSECSELSMDQSMKEEVNATFRHLEEIEQNLGELKCSVLEMDEEVAMFVTKPDPYSLKMTYSGNSQSSNSDNEDSVSFNLDVQQQNQTKLSSNSENANMVEEAVVPSVLRSSDTEAECSLEWDSPQHNLSKSLKNNQTSGLKSIASDESSIATSLKEEGLNSLEWDDGDGLKQYAPQVEVTPLRPIKRDDSIHDFHDNQTIGLRKMKGFDAYREKCQRDQLLPNHCSMELDLEEELNASPIEGDDRNKRGNRNQNRNSLKSLLEKIPSLSSQNSMMTLSTDSALPSSMNASAMSISSFNEQPMMSSNYSVMANSTDSAVYSAPGSRSATASPNFVQNLESPMDAQSPAGCSKHFTSTYTVNEERSECEGRRGGVRDETVLSSLSDVRRHDSSSSSSSSTSSPSHISRSLQDLQEKCSRSSKEGLNLLMYDNINGNGDELALTRQKISNRNIHRTNLPTTLTDSHNLPSTTAETYCDNLPTTITDCQISPTSFEKHKNVPRNDYLPTTISDILNDNDALLGNRVDNANDIMGNLQLSGGGGRKVTTIGDKVSLLEYSLREWQGNTSKAETIRQGYNAVEAHTGLSKLRTVRGDNYCAIRASIFQGLLSGQTLPRGDFALSRLTAELSSGSSWINQWTFGGRLQYDSVMEGAKDCLETLDSVSDNLVASDSKESCLVDLLNSCQELDMKLCEAVKLHMLVSALQLYGLSLVGSEVPLFSMILFARESSDCPASFMLNHLNAVGDSAGLEQVEMFLLGYTLKASLRVVRPSSFGNEDFICHYPDDEKTWGQLSLIAEDDRHYNILVN